ncbi:TlpA disulfide reductase family protein [Rhizobium sp. SSA_523]|uniref:thiol:disulfide interchange protein TlpA n=1 Tax=Rhizobium sp. SSA_523 TaxID=2952477 RepID=UPI002090FBEC|nr:TlpA disulfide reductase family protein [Rhizobium sp. SSA_523]MCO5733680.1 TlpA family protein disulfide reductase [Rhizobium sp. SSA_523]WKC23029.1 TlpA disulfide reductase family protein [Rhizobium sp. SSA_523]
MPNKRPLGLPSVRLILFAAVAGIIAGLVAVYVKPTLSGNGEVAAQTQCEGAVAQARTVSELAQGELAALSGAAEPRRLETLSFTGPEGRKLTLADFEGKTVLLNLWATWCVPCREEMPALNALQVAKGSDRFEVVAINIDTGSDEKPKAFLEETGVHALAPYRDSSMGVFNALKKEGLAFGLPVTLVINREGCLIGAMNGPAIWDGPQAQTLIDRVLAL